MHIKHGGNGIEGSAGIASLRSSFGRPAAGYLRFASVPARNATEMLKRRACTAHWLGGQESPRSLPILISTLLLTVLSVNAAFAAELVHAKDGSGIYGYKDTPKLAWCEWLVHDPDRPAPPKVNPGAVTPPAPQPADAIVLFDGKDLSQWTDSTWVLKDGLMIAEGKTSPQTKQEFGSFQLHLEWKAPEDFQGHPMSRGNNGVLLHGRYEIQIFDSFNEPIYPDGQCAAIYGQTPPLVNVTRPPGQWQTYDIVFIAPKFDGAGKLLEAARVTVFHNGVLVHHNQIIHGGTGHRILPDYSRALSKGPILFGGHGCPVAFRNIWIRPLEKMRDERNDGAQ